jgi:hypothetical protein
MVPVMNLDHTAIEVILSDYYAGDWVDRLDELKPILMRGKSSPPQGQMPWGAKRMS